MTDAPAAPSAAGDTMFEPVGSGLNVTEFAEPVEGRIKWLDSPDEVIDFVEETDDIEDYIVIVRGGTTTFLTPALTAGIRGVITLQGAPESHLGIVSREYGIPCVMSVAFEKGVRTARGEIVPADGVRGPARRLHQAPRQHLGRGGGAGRRQPRPRGPGRDEPRADGPDYGAAGEVRRRGPARRRGRRDHARRSHHVRPRRGRRAGHAQDLGRRSQRPGQVPHLERVGRTRRTRHRGRVGPHPPAGVRGPRHPQQLVPPPRLAPGRRRHGRGAGRHRHRQARPHRDRHQDQPSAQLGHDHGVELRSWHRAGDGPARRGHGCVGHRRRHHRGAPPLQGPLGRRGHVHLDARLSGPAPGRLLDRPVHQGPHPPRRRRRAHRVPEVQRLHRAARLPAPLRQPARPRRQRPLPTAGRRLRVGARSVRERAVVPVVRRLRRLALRRHDGDVRRPRQRARRQGQRPVHDVQHPGELRALHQRRRDLHPAALGHPDGRARVLSLDDAAALRTRVEAVSDALYRRIATMGHKEKVLAGAAVYTAGFALPLARAAGVLDELLANHGFNDLHPTAEGAYDAIVGGVATEMIPRLFLTGSWGVPLRADLES